ncbi:MAG: HAD family hydrolase [Anaeromyxobacter sp.]
MEPQAPRTRVVEAFSIARQPVSFRELCRRAVPEDTRLLVLDLDRTLHLGRNMGELLGWELSAYQGYGPSYLEALEPRRPPGRLYLDRRRPLGALRYLWIACVLWMPPGLFYLLWCKIAAHLDLLRRRSFLRYGPEPVAAVQRVPQFVLFRQMATLPPALVRELATRVWARYRPDLVIEREDLDWLRARCPGVRVVLSSASPQLVAEVAGEALGIEDVIGSSLHRINGGRTKLATLRALYPQLLGAPGVTTVGMSDTGYGEDHCWTEAFTTLVDVNSSSGFPPIVAAASPLRAIHSAQNPHPGREGGPRPRRRLAGSAARQGGGAPGPRPRPAVPGAGAGGAAGAAARRGRALRLRAGAATAAAGRRAGAGAGGVRRHRPRAGGGRAGRGPPRPRPAGRAGGAAGGAAAAGPPRPPGLAGRLRHDPCAGALAPGAGAGGGIAARNGLRPQPQASGRGKARLSMPEARLRRTP